MFKNIIFINHKTFSSNNHWILYNRNISPPNSAGNVNVNDAYRNYASGPTNPYNTPTQQNLPPRPYNQQQPSACPSSPITGTSVPSSNQYTPAPPQQFDYRQDQVS